MSTELTAAEQAAAEALNEAWPHLLNDGLQNEVAQVVVAAVYPIIAAGELDEAATTWEYDAHDHQGTHPALWLRTRAAALRATEKGTTK